METLLITKAPLKSFNLQFFFDLFIYTRALIFRGTVHIGAPLGFSRAEFASKHLKYWSFTLRMGLNGSTPKGTISNKQGARFVSNFRKRTANFALHVVFFVVYKPRKVALPWRLVFSISLAFPSEDFWLRFSFSLFSWFISKLYLFCFLDVLQVKPKRNKLMVAHQAALFVCLVSSWEVHARTEHK